MTKIDNKLQELQKELQVYIGHFSTDVPIGLAVECLNIAEKLQEYKFMYEGLEK